jgi:hypothetical protein
MPSAVSLLAAFVLMASLALLTPVRSAEAIDDAASDWSSFSSSGAFHNADSSSVLTVTGDIEFPNSSHVLIQAANLTIQGGIAVVMPGSMGDSIAGYVNAYMSPAQLDQLANQAQTLSSNSINDARSFIDSNGMFNIKGAGTERTLNTPDSFQNNLKWLSVDAVNTSSPYNGLNLINLHFTDVDVEYSYGANPSAFARNGITNGLIGNVNTASARTTLGDIKGNAFTNLTVRLKGPRDDQYLAGGGIIGVRATGEGTNSPADAQIGTISGNFFSGVNVTTTDTDDDVTNDTGHKSTYLEGGGLIGVDAASSPADKKGVAEIKELTNNIFTDIHIHTGDVLIGGGLIGLNNNSKHTFSGGETIASASTYANLGKANGNVFAGGIEVNVGYSIRGGGVIGLNGLSTAGATLGELKNNIFSGINVKTGKSYIKGGGIVGLQTNYIDVSEKDKFGESGTLGDSDFTGILDDVKKSPWTYLTEASGNLFIDSNVEAATYLYGGGILGLHSAEATAFLGVADNNLFRNLNVTVNGNDGAANPYSLKGGGVIGVSSKKSGFLGEVSMDYFDRINVSVAGKLAGGGIIGIQSDATANDDFSLGSNIAHNSFTNINVKASAIEGGGVVGAQGENAFEIFGGDDVNSYTGLSGNRVRDVAVVTDSYISGGGVFGIYSNGGNANMYNVNHNTFDNTKITAGSYIEGGGLVGLRTNGTGEIRNVNNNYFMNSEITAGTYIDGGGILGVTSGAPNVGGVLGITNIINSAFFGNTVTANNGTIAGGLVYAYGTDNDGMTIKNSYLGGNTFISNYTGGSDYASAGKAKVYGAVTIDTGNGSFPVNTLNLQATDGYYTYLGDNKTVIDNGTPASASSLYFGTINGMTTAADGQITVQDDPAAADAQLNIQTDSGGYVFLFDPIEVNQNGGYTFNMDVDKLAGDAAGYFLWDGENKFNLEDSIGPLKTAEVNLRPGSHTQIMEGMSLSAPRHTFNLNQGGELTVMGKNEMTLTKANLNGDLIFRLGGTTVNNQTDALLTINKGEGSPQYGFVDITGSTVRLTAITPYSMNGKSSLEAGDRFYLIATDGENYILGSPANDGAVSTYARVGYTDSYNFIIDTSVPYDPGNPTAETEGEGPKNQYLVARIPFPAEPAPVNPEPEPIDPQPEPPVPQPPVNPDPDQPVTPPDPIDPQAPVDPDPDQPVTPQPEPPVNPEPNQPVNPPQPMAPDPDHPIPSPATPDTPAPVTPVTPTPGPTPHPTPVVPSNQASGQDDYRTPAPETSAITNGRLAGLAFVGARGSWLPDHSYESAEIALSGDILSDDVLGRSRAAFAGIDGAWMRVHNDNSHVDFDGTNMIIGFASKERKKGDDDKPDSSLLWAAFIDIGHANYDTYDNFNFVTNRPIDDIHGDGTLRSYGIGLMARKEWADGFRLEGSLRGGKLKNEFTASNYELGGIPLSYTADSPYYGLHLGAGKTIVLDNPRDRLDLLFRYYWNRQNGDTATLPDGNWIDFDNDDSHRIRLGARFTRAHDYRRSWYVGAALEHEFAGSIHARTSQFTLPAYDLEGTTGIGEIGVIIRPDRDDDDKDKDFSLEAGLQGYTGKYSGISAGIRFEWEF